MSTESGEASFETPVREKPILTERQVEILALVADQAKLRFAGRA
jgi:DNA-binding CsgD family transcriptional regulator